MQFIHKRQYLRRGDVVVVTCSQPCNVKLTDDNNFNRYEIGRSYNFYGGFFRELPARILAPDEGYWNITIDIGEGTATIKHTIDVIRGARSIVE
jgi:Domain of unknown function (DUF1883)